MESSGEPLHKVLVAVKDEINREALIQALHPLRGKASIVFYHVVQVPFTSALYEEVVKPMVEEAEKRLRPLVEWASAQGFKAESRIVVSRDVSESIKEEAEKPGYFMVVIQRDVGGLRLRPSLSAKIIQSLRVPVLVLPPV